MIRQGQDKDAVFANLDIFPDDCVEMVSRPAKGDKVWTKLVMGPELPGIQLKLIRKGTMNGSLLVAEATGTCWTPSS